MTKYILILVIILIVALGFSIKSCSETSEENKRLTTNQSILLDKATFYQTKDSLSAASVERLILTIRELKDHRSDLTKTVEKLNIKIDRLRSINESATKTEYIIETVFRDSIIYREGRVDTMKCVNYRDKYLTFSGCEIGGIFSGKIESRDTLTTLVHRVPRKFLFVKWGTKAIRQEVISKNPHSKITYTEYIELK